MALTLTDVLLRIGGDIKPLEKEIDAAVKNIDRAGGKFSTVGTRLSKSVTAPLVGIGAAALLASESMDGLERAVAAGTGASGQALEQLERVAKQVFTSVPDDARKAGVVVANFNTEIGITGSQLETLSRQALTAARALGEDAAALSKGLGKALTQFQEPAETAGQHLDNLFQLSQRYGVGLTALIGKLNEYGSNLINAGFSMAESAELMAQLEKGGISVSRIMPGLNKAFRDMAVAGKEPREELGRIITAMGDAASKQEALKIATEAFGAEGAQRLTTAVRQNLIDLSALGDGYADAAGAVENSKAAILTSTEELAKARNQLTVALEPLGDELKQALAGALESATPLVARLGELTKAFFDLHPAVGPATVAVGAFAAALGPLVFAVGGLAGPLAAATPKVVAFARSLTLLAGVKTGGILLAAAALFKLVDGALALQGARDELDTLPTLEEQAKSLANHLGKLFADNKKLADQIGTLQQVRGESTKEYIARLRDIALELGKVKAGELEATEGAKEFGGAVSEVGEAASAWAEQIAAWSQAAGTAVDGFLAKDQALRSAVLQQAAAQESLREVTEALQQQAVAELKRAEEGIKAVEAEMAKARDTIDSANGPVEDIALSTGELATVLENVAGIAPKTNKELDDLAKRGLQQVSTAISDLAKIIATGDFEGLGDLFTKLRESLTQIVLEDLLGRVYEQLLKFGNLDGIFKNLISSVGGFFGGLFGGGGGGSSQTVSFPQLGNTNASAASGGGFGGGGGGGGTNIGTSVVSLALQGIDLNKQFQMEATLNAIEHNTKITAIAIGGDTAAGSGGIGIRDTLFRISENTDFVQPSLDSLVQSNLDILAELRAGIGITDIEESAASAIATAAASVPPPDVRTVAGRSRGGRLTPEQQLFRDLLDVLEQSVTGVGPRQEPLPSSTEGQLGRRSPRGRVGSPGLPEGAFLGGLAGINQPIPESTGEELTETLSPMLQRWEQLAEFGRDLAAQAEARQTFGGTKPEFISKLFADMNSALGGLLDSTAEGVTQRATMIDLLTAIRDKPLDVTVKVESNEPEDNAAGLRTQLLLTPALI